MSINLIIDNNGVIQKSKDARREYGQAQENEQEDLEGISDAIDEVIAEPAPKVDVNTKAEENSTINGKKGNANNPTIPKGYIPIDTETSIWGDGNKAPTRDSVNHGLVIKDEDGNEWVWIPVPDVTEMCDISNLVDHTLSGTTSIATKWYSKSGIINRTTPGNATVSSYREPDIIEDIGVSRKNYECLGFESEEELAKAFVTDYNEMIESIEQYGGFYIGRYELSSEGVQKDKVPLYRVSWYGAYQKCKMLNASEEVETQMIWGCQWDATCNFIANKGDKKDIEDSRSWGNYWKSTENAAVMEGTEQKYGRQQNTGYSEYWKANNIYDLAGNCSEWTQEAYNKGLRVYRGDNCFVGDSVVGYYSADQYFLGPNSSDMNFVGARPTLVIKKQ